MNDHLLATDALPTREAVTGWHALDGLVLGTLRGPAPGTDVAVTVERVLETSTDLAVADRVAYVAAAATGCSHVVLTAPEGYLVARVGPALDWAAAMRLVPVEYMPRIVSVATDEGVLPVLLPLSA